MKRLLFLSVVPLTALALLAPAPCRACPAAGFAFSGGAGYVNSFACGAADPCGADAFALNAGYAGPSAFAFSNGFFLERRGFFPVFPLRGRRAAFVPAGPALHIRAPFVDLRFDRFGRLRGNEGADKLTAESDKKKVVKKPRPKRDD